MLKFVSNLVDLLKKGIFFFQLFQIKIEFLPVWFPQVLLSCIKSKKLCVQYGCYIFYFS